MKIGISVVVAASLAIGACLICTRAVRTRDIAPIDAAQKAAVWHMGWDVKISPERIFEARLAAREALRKNPDMARVDCYIAPDGSSYTVIWLIPAYEYERLEGKLAPYNDLVGNILFGVTKPAENKEPNKALVPTVMSVTPAADAPVAPATTAAHL